MKKVSISLLTYNSLKYLPACLESIAAQTYPRLDLLVVDNASADGTVNLLRRDYPDVRLVMNTENCGYSGGHNQGIRATDGEFVLLLNPDVFMTSTFIEEKVRAAEQDERVGMVEGRLLKAEFDGQGWRKTGLIDSTGLLLRKNRKNYERGHGEPDDGRYGSIEFVFGAFGAAPLYRRDMLEDIKIGEEYLDEDFFAYREEVDLAWRAQLRGWRCIYIPAAVAYHVHAYAPATRKQQPRRWRRLQFRNRYLLMLKNDTPADMLRHAPHILWFELLALGYTLVREPHLLLGYLDVLKLSPRMMRKRRWIQSRKLVSDAHMLRWFW